jgi:hypothetical protein
VVPMANADKARTISAAGMPSAPEKVMNEMFGLERLADVFEERLDGLFIAFEEVPLANLLAADQPRALQGGQVRGDCGLRQPGALVDLAGADADFQRVILIGEIDVWVFQPVQDFTSYRMGQRLDHVIDVELHVSRSVSAVTPYRDGANLISVAHDIQIVRADSHHHVC